MVFLHFSLQFFHIASHNGGGGESLIVDGIACALKLQQENKQAFDFLANNAVPGVYFVRIQFFNVANFSLKIKRW